MIGSSSASGSRGSNLVLFGMMGAGKTTVGRWLAERLDRELVDTDGEVERLAGAPIAEIFADHGEATFRQLERRVVAAAAEGAGQVIAVGGGAVLDDVNLAALRARGRLVLLEAASDVLAGRVTSGEERPLLAGGSAATLRSLLRERSPRYREAADHRVDASRPVEEVVADVLDWAMTVDGLLSAAERERFRR